MIHLRMGNYNHYNCVIIFVVVGNGSGGVGGGGGGYIGGILGKGVVV